MTSTRHPLYSGVRYRAFPTGHDYVFTFAYVVDARTWRAYIQDSPEYRSRPADAHSTHRLRDEHGMFVCWDAPVRTLSECQGVAALWADCTESYLRTGHFTEPRGRPKVQDRSVLATADDDTSRPRPSAASRRAAATSSPLTTTLQRLMRRW